MKMQITMLNRAFIDGKLGLLQYEQKARALLAHVGEQHRVQWLNMLFVVV